MNIYLPQQGKKYIPKQKNIPFSIKNKKSFINFGFFSIQAKNFGTVTPRQLEAGRRFLVRNLTRKSRLWRTSRVTQSLTKKSKQSRMGKGKGKFFGWVGYIKPGTSLYELGYFSRRVKRSSKIFLKVSNKFSFDISLRKRPYIFSKFNLLNYEKKLREKKNFTKELKNKKDN